MTASIPLAAPPASATTVQGTGPELRRQATSFAAVAIGELLAPIFATTDETGGLFGGGEAEATWRPMLVQEIAKRIAAAGGLGLGDVVMRQLLALQEHGR